MYKYLDASVLGNYPLSDTVEEKRCIEISSSKILPNNKTDPSA